VTGPFRDRVVLVTGASAGIGAALARELARQGADLVLVARRADRLEALAGAVRALGRRALAVRADVTRDGDLERAVAAARETFGRLDVVVANAGFGVVGDVARLTLDDYRRQFETNVWGVLRTVWATLDDLRRTKGRLVIVGSVSGHVSMPGGSPYAMSKFAVRALADSLYVELARDGVAVTLVSPGFVASEIRRVDNQGRLRAEPADPVLPWLVVPAPRAARAIARAVARRRREAVITGHGKIVVFVHRHAPWLLPALMRRVGIRSRRDPATAAPQPDR
jgi:NADP-dependent 3-hydroxy acid dehydrogenase YdfG